MEFYVVNIFCHYGNLNKVNTTKTFYLEPTKADEILKNYIMSDYENEKEMAYDSWGDDIDADEDDCMGYDLEHYYAFVSKGKLSENGEICDGETIYEFNDGEWKSEAQLRNERNIARLYRCNVDLLY